MQGYLWILDTEDDKEGEDEVTERAHDANDSSKKPEPDAVRWALDEGAQVYVVTEG